MAFSLVNQARGCEMIGSDWLSDGYRARLTSSAPFLRNGCQIENNPRAVHQHPGGQVNIVNSSGST